MREGSQIEYYVTDVETTGLSPKYGAELIEASFVRYSDQCELFRYITPERPWKANWKSLEVTGRNYNDFKNRRDPCFTKGIQPTKLIELVEKFFEQDGKTARYRCMIAHNHSFDKRFLDHLWRSQGKEFPAEMWLDTMKLAKLWSLKIGQKWPTRKLEDVLERTGIRVADGSHDAKSDTRNTFILCKKAVDEMNLDYLECIKRYEPGE